MHLRMVQLLPYRLLAQRHDDPPGKLWQTWLFGHWVMLSEHSSTSGTIRRENINIFFSFKLRII